MNDFKPLDLNPMTDRGILVELLSTGVLNRPHRYIYIYVIHRLL